MNDRAALELLLTRGPLTRSQLGELTGLSKVTASQLVERLEERGLVHRVGEQAGGRGPNAQLYSVRPDSAYVVGVEAGPDHVVAACADISGTVAARVEHSTQDTDDPVGVVHRAVLSAVDQAGAAMTDVRRIVVGTPGLIDPATGDITFAYDLPRWHRGLAAALRDDLDTTIMLENDVNLAAVAELHAGVAQEVADFLLVWLSGGVGMAVVLGRRLHLGNSGAAGEIGYLPVPGAEITREVQRRGKGAFAQIASAEAVRAVAREHGFKARTASDAVRAVIAAGVKGGPVLDELARRLALGVAASCVVLDPPLVVLAGEIGVAGGAPLAERVQHEVAAISPVQPRVVVSGVTEEPVLRGAILTALDAVRDEVFGSTVG